MSEKRLSAQEEIDMLDRDIRAAEARKRELLSEAGADVPPPDTLTVPRGEVEVFADDRESNSITEIGVTTKGPDPVIDVSLTKGGLSLDVRWNPEGKKSGDLLRVFLSREAADYIADAIKYKLKLRPHP